MMLKTKSCLAILTLLCLTDSVLVAHAQTYTPSNRIPVADSTLGTQVTGTGNNFNITGGLVKGQTLFHSFSDLSVPTNGRVDFTNPAGNRDIITRVTGASFSDINGILNTSGANFFLINPNGIVFGTGAQLNVGKAFVGSTASSLDLVAGNGSTITFGTNPSGDAPLLSVAPNVMFDVSRLNLGGGAGAISNFGTLKTTNPNQYIGLIGGNVTMNGGQIISPGGRVEIGGLSAPGTVTLGVEENNLRAQFPTNVPRGDVSLANTTVNVSLLDRFGQKIAGAQGSSDIAITAQNIGILNSSIRSGIEQQVRTTGSIAGNININATDKISIDNSNIASFTYGGRGGDLNITTRDLSFINSSYLSTMGIANSSPTYAGDINIKATGDIFMDNKVSISNYNYPYPASEGGKINIAARNLSLTNNSTIAAIAKLNIIATGNVLLDASRLDSRASSLSGGAGGIIDITAQNLSLAHDARLDVTAVPKFSGGISGGDININTSGNVSFDNSGAYSQTGYIGGGSGGNINITTQNLSLTNNARLDNSATGVITSSSIKGKSGNININAEQNVSIDRSGISSQIGDKSQGQGGSIDIKSRNLSITNGGSLVVSNLGKVVSGIGTGSAGNINLNSSKLELNNGSITSSSASATGGNINIINTDYLLLNNNSSISTSSGSTTSGGNGGNITITSPLIIAAPGNNDITANAYQGTGGRVDIASQGLFGIEYRTIGSNFTNDITASSTFGQSGAVKVSTPGTDPGKDSTELPKVPTDATKQISQSCGGSNRQNKLTVTGRGGLPANANDLLTADVLWQDSSVAQTSLIASSVPTTQNLAPPAVGFVFDGKGRVTLVAAGTSGQPTGTKISCPPEVN